MALEQACWIATAAYGAHILEESILDWRGWVRSVANVTVDAETFYVGNSLVILLGIVCAEVAKTMPMIALAFPSLLLINATCFHVAAFVWKRGRFSPGLITSVLLFYPIGFWCYRVANDNAALTWATICGSLALGVSIMLLPVLLIKARSLRYLRQRE